MRTFERLVRGFIGSVRKDGVVQTLRIAVDVCRPATFGVYVLGEQSAGYDYSDIQVVRGLEHLRICREQFPELIPEFYLDQRKGGKDCFVATWKGKPAGIVWILDRAFPSRFICFNENEAELGYLFVLPRLRGAGIATTLINSAVTDSPGRRVYAVIDDRNLASQRVFIKCGFQRIATLRRAALWGPRYSSMDGPIECGLPQDSRKSDVR